MKRWLTWLLVLVVLGGLGALSFPAMTWLQERNAPKDLTVTVSRGRVETVVNSTGTVKPETTVSVGAFTSGPIRKIDVKFNSEITAKDQVLAWIDDKLQRVAVERDRAALETQVAEAKRVKHLLEQAVINEIRADEVRTVNKDYLSKTEWDTFVYAKRTLQAQVELAEANVRQARANLKNSEEQLSYTKVQLSYEKETGAANRIKGKVIERKVDPGQTVAASFQTPELFTIGLNMEEHMHVYASVDEADIGMIQGAKEKQKAVKFTVDAYPGRLFDGTIHDIRMNSTTTQNVVTYPVIIDAPNEDQKLMPGMTANITFQIEAKEDVLRIPAAALRFTPLAAQVREEDRHYLETITSVPAGGKRSASEKADMALSRHRRVVWVQDGLVLKAVPITLGLIENQFAEVVGGELKEGQEIVTGVEGVLPPR